MNTKHLVILLGLWLSGSLFLSIYGQTDYEIRYDKDSLKISGKWVHAKFFDDNSPLELRLKIENNSKTTQVFEYEILLYLNLMLREKTEKNQLSIKAGKVLQGKINGVRFLPSTLTNEDINSDNFSWEINIEPNS